MFALLSKQKATPNSEVEDDDDGGDNPSSVGGGEDDPIEEMMPDSWTFPGFITFACLLGPIVPNGMIQHRSELLMSSPPAPTTTGILSTNGRNAQRKTQRKEYESKRNKKLRQDEQIRNRVNNATSAPTATPAAYTGTLHQHIQVAGLANMRLLSEKREVARINDRIIAMHTRTVAGIQAVINEQKYLIDHTEAGDPNRTQYLVELKDMNTKLGIAIQNLTMAEQKIIDDAKELKIESSAVTMFVNNTIARLNTQHQSIIEEKQEVQEQEEGNNSFDSSSSGDNSNSSNNSNE